MEVDQHEQALIERIAASVEALAHQRRIIPLSIDLWDFETIALYLKRSQQQVRERVACLPTFPKAIRLPIASGERAAHPLFRASEVIAWAESHQEPSRRVRRKRSVIA